MMTRSTRRPIVVSHRHRKRSWSVSLCILELLPAIVTITVVTNGATLVKSAVSAIATQLPTMTHGLWMLRGGASSGSDDDEEGNNNNNKKYPRFLGDIDIDDDRNDDFDKDILDEYVEFLLAFAEDRATEEDNPLFRDLPNNDMAAVDEEEYDKNEEEAESISVDLESVGQVDIDPQNMEVVLAGSLLKNVVTIDNNASVHKMDTTGEPGEDKQEKLMVVEDSVSVQNVSEADGGKATQALDGLSLDQQLETPPFIENVEDVDQIDEYVDTLISSMDGEEEDQTQAELELILEEVVPVHMVDDEEEKLEAPFVDVGPTTSRADPALTTTKGMRSLDADDRAMDVSTEIRSMPVTTAPLDIAKNENAESIPLRTTFVDTVRRKEEHQGFTDTNYENESSDISVESNMTDTKSKPSTWNRFLDSWVETVLDDEASIDDKHPEVVLNEPSNLDFDERQAALVVESEEIEPEKDFHIKSQRLGVLNTEDENEKASSWSFQQYYHNTVATAKDQYHRVWGTLNGFLGRPRDMSSRNDAASSSLKPANYESTLRDHNKIFEKYFSQHQTLPTDNHGSEDDRSDIIVTETQTRSPLDFFKRPWGNAAGIFNQRSTGEPDSVEISPQAEGKEREDEGISIFDTRPETETLPLITDDKSTATLGADELVANEMIVDQPDVDRGVEAASFYDEVEARANNVDIEEASLTSAAFAEESVSAPDPSFSNEEIQKGNNLAQVESSSATEKDAADVEAKEEYIVTTLDLIPPVDAPEIKDAVAVDKVYDANEEHDDIMEDEVEEETLDDEAQVLEFDSKYEEEEEEEEEEDEAAAVLEDVDVVEADNEYATEDSLLDLDQETFGTAGPSGEFDEEDEDYDNETEESNARYDTTADHKEEEDLLQWIGKGTDVGFEVDSDNEEIDEEEDVAEKLEGARLVGRFDADDIDVSGSDLIAEPVEYEGTNTALKFLLNRGLQHWVMAAIVIFEWVRFFILAPLVESYMWIQNGEAQRLFEEGMMPPEWFRFRGGALESSCVDIGDDNDSLVG